MPTSKVNSDGMTASYYDIPSHVTQLSELISHHGMSHSRGEAICALVRMNKKSTTDISYDINKVRRYLDLMEAAVARGERI